MLTSSAALIRQRRLYDRVAENYITNLTYSHTAEYTHYLDKLLLSVIGPQPLGCALELCCGQGDGLKLISSQCRTTIGIDISSAMLGCAEGQSGSNLVQADATTLPLTDNSCDLVLILGGIHHINNRNNLFSEVFRVLKPSGRLVFREPANDFWLWRMLRWVVYHLSPALDSVTEHPLRHDLTHSQLIHSGLTPTSWVGCGFIGFCLFMNSDILVINRILRFVPGIRHIVRLSAALDELCLKTLNRLGVRSLGLQVIGVAVK